MDREGFTNRFDRREILAGAGTIVIAATAGSQAGATPDVSPVLPRRIGFRTLADVSPILDANNWVSAKRNLIAKYSFLSAFQSDLTVDQIVYNVTSSVVNVTPTYDPYQIENLIASSSSLLDRCLNYRREMYGLEEQAVRRALEYQLYKDQRAAQYAIELSARAETQRLDEQKGQDAAASKFGSVVDKEPLASGFAAISGAASQSLLEAITSEQERKNNVDIKWKAADAYQLALEARHSSPGNALNYSERFDRIRGLLEQDIAIAYQKIKCVSLGAKRIFGISIPLESPTQLGYIDVLVKYVRDIIDAIEQATVSETDFEHVVSLHQVRTLRGTPNTFQLLQDDPWNNGLFKSPWLVSFYLDKEFPPAVKTLRLRGLGISFVTSDADKADTHLRSIAAAVFPPETQEFFGDGTAFIARSPVIFERVSVFDPNGVRYVQVPSIYNIDPRSSSSPIGWQIILSSNAIFPDGSAKGTANTFIKDIKLHMRLSGILSTTSADWTSLSW